MFQITVIFTLTFQRFLKIKKRWKNKKNVKKRVFYRKIKTFINVYYNYGIGH